MNLKKEFIEGLFANPMEPGQGPLDGMIVWEPEALVKKVLVYINSKSKRKFKGIDKQITVYDGDDDAYILVFFLTVDPNITDRDKIENSVVVQIIIDKFANIISMERGR